MALRYRLTLDTIPDELAKHDHWVCWKTEHRTNATGGKPGSPTKVPVNPKTGGYASVSNSETWTSLTTASQHYQDEDTDVHGIGYVFTAADPFVGIDLDNCRTLRTGKLADWAKDIIQQLESYTETSPSATGTHIHVTGTLPDGRKKHGDIEMYDRDRYFTVTGRHLTLTPDTINERTQELAAIHDEYLADIDTDHRDAAVSALDRPKPGTSTRDLPDRKLLEKACEAANGDTFQRLWNGDITGYKSHSEADQALCNILAFWTGGDLDSPDEDVISPLIEELNKLTERKGAIKSRLEELDGEISTAQTRLERKENEVENKLDEKSRVEDVSKRANLASNVRNAVQDFREELAKEKLRRLESKLSERYITLSNKGNFYEKIEIDEDSLDISIKTVHGNRKPHTELSAGERQIFATSLLWALAEISDRPLPFIVDTPLGRLDNDHRDNLITHFFPEASHQVIIFSTDTEIDDDQYKKLEGNISQAYHLEYNEKEGMSIPSKGYFWTKENEDQQSLEEITS